MENSQLLNELFARAKRQEGTGNTSMTAEKFLLAVIETLTEVNDPTPEHQDMRMVVEMHIKDMDAAKKVLVAHIEDIKDATFTDSVYMQSKVYEANAQATKNAEKQLTTPTLLYCIFNSPSTTIKNSMGAKENMSSGMSIEELEQEVDRQLRELGIDPQDVEEEILAEREEKPQNKMAALVSEVKTIREKLSAKVFGQDNAINVFVTGYFQANMLALIDKSRKRPKATFLFAGPPGVGKTFLAENVAEVLGLPFKRYDMSEYVDDEANLEFCGSDKVYKNGKAGNVTSFVEKNPKCVLLFDEIEKAHLSVVYLFLQMLDAGRLRDNFTDNEVSFKDAIIILTTNAGKQLYEDSENANLSTISRKVIIKALQKDINPESGTPFFPPAICSRFASGNVVMFNHITANNLITVAQNEIERHAKSLEKETGIQFDIEKAVYSALLFAEGAVADARTVRGRSEAFLNDELYELFRLVESDKVEIGIGDIKKIKVDIDLSGADAEIQSFFSAGEPPKTLVFAEQSIVDSCKNKLADIHVLGADTVDKAVELLKDEDVKFVMLDITCQVAESSFDRLNIEDVDSQARKFLQFLQEQRNNLPVYLIEKVGEHLTAEEQVSFMRQGVRGVLELSEDGDTFVNKVRVIAESLHQQESMTELGKANKLVSYETAQTIEEDGQTAKITLFDFKLVVAVDSEDSKNVLSAVSKPDVKFEDVIGAEDAKKELKYFVEYLKNPKKYMGTGVKAPKGVILYGPPGTGKTMLAKAMASESGVTFIAAEGNQFLKKYVGEGPESVHELFRTARKYAPAILFVDEIDAIAKERTGSDDGASEVAEATLTAFLTEMDGFSSDPTKPVFVLAATNFDVTPGSRKSLDAALMRRFDRRIFIDLPNKEERIRFLHAKISKNETFEISEEKIDNIAMRAMGMSLASLDSVIELALRSAIRDGSTKVTDAILEEAFETFNSGEAKKWDADQLERVARHEAGHAFLCWHSGETPSYLTIVARGNHGGYMQHADNEGKMLYTKEELLARIRTFLGGRAAEIVYYGEKDGVSTGASGDLSSATGTAMRIVCDYGMDESFGLAVVDDVTATNGAMSLQVREVVNDILKEQMTEAIRIISENKDKMDALVASLMTNNHLTGPEIEEILK